MSVQLVCGLPENSLKEDFKGCWSFITLVLVDPLIAGKMSDLPFSR